MKKRTFITVLSFLLALTIFFQVMPENIVKAQENLELEPVIQTEQKEAEILYEIDLERFSSDLSDSIARYIAVSLRNKYISVSRDNQKYRSLCSELYENQIFDKCDAIENIFIADALRRLSAKQKLVIVYKYIYNYSDTELAFMLGTTRQAINRIKNRALSVLKKLL